MEEGDEIAAELVDVLLTVFAWRGHNSLCCSRSLCILSRPTSTPIYLDPKPPPYTRGND